MGSRVAVENFSYSLDGVTEVTPNSATISPPPSAKSKIAGKKIYSGPVTITFAIGTLSSQLFTSSGTNTAPAVFTVSPSKIRKFRIDGKIALGAEDVSSPVQVIGLMTSGTSVNPVSVSATVKISSAGQSKVSAA